MKDMIGEVVRPGDHLVDERGKVFLAEETPLTFQREGLVQVRPVAGPHHTYLRLAHVFIHNSYGREQENRRRWRELYEEHVRPRRRAEIAERRRKMAELRQG